MHNYHTGNTNMITVFSPLLNYGVLFMRADLTSNVLYAYKIMLVVIFDLFTKLAEQPARVDLSWKYISVVKCNQNKSKNE